LRPDSTHWLPPQLPPSEKHTLFLVTVASLHNMQNVNVEEKTATSGSQPKVNLRDETESFGLGLVRLILTEF